jgi:hypothetical protein
MKVLNSFTEPYTLCLKPPRYSALSGEIDGLARHVNALVGVILQFLGKFEKLSIIPHRIVEERCIGLKP